MQIQTYEQEVERHPEACEESKRLIAELGLHGQSAAEPMDGRNPYRLMTKEEYAVYSILFPAQTSVESYNADTIPLRVLQVLAHAKTLGIFEGFLVMHPEAAFRDPVLVAYMPNKRYSGTLYLLARWGEALDEFAVLAERAGKIRHRQIVAAYEDIISKAQAALATAKGRLEAPVTASVPQLLVW